MTHNVGRGLGNSVLDVIRAVEEIGGCRVPTRTAARRPDDPAVLVAGSARIRQDTVWEPRYRRFHDIIATAYAWRERHPQGYRTPR